MTPPDTLNRIGILTRREIEARMLAPIITALCEKFDRAEVIATVRDTIIAIAQQQGGTSRTNSAVVGWLNSNPACNIGPKTMPCA
jgi:hypothetical protein